MGKPIHFEVFFKKHRKADWALVEACPQREDALDKARALIKANPAGSVRVSREQYDEAERAFHTITVFEAGAERFSDGGDRKGEAKLPCVSPADLAGAAARATLRRVLSGWFERHEVCPLELIHRPDLADRLDGDDTDLQHAIQKYAVARAQADDAPVHDYVKLLNTLAEKALAEARREAKRAREAPPAGGAGFAELASRIHAEGTPEKRLRAAIADRLAEAPGMGRKAEMLLDFLDDLPSDPEARAFAEAQADAFLAEILSFDRALEQVLGRTRDLGERVERLTSVYEGSPEHEMLDRAPAHAKRLAGRFRKRALPAAHGEIARRILTLLRAPKRFKPDSVFDEIKLARALAQRLIAASGPNLHPDALVEAFTHRSARLLAPDSVDEALEGSRDPVEQLERLFAMEDNLVGAMNKAKLASYVRARLAAQPTDSWFRRGPGQPLARLSRLSSLAARAASGGFSKEDKAEMAGAFEALALGVLDETKILDRIAASERPALDRAAALLKLAAEGLLPPGRCREDAENRAMRLAASPEGRREAADPGGAAKMEEVQALLARLAPPPQPDAAPDDASERGASETGASETGAAHEGEDGEAAA